jgi:ATP-dependent Lon protease
VEEEEFPQFYQRRPAREAEAAQAPEKTAAAPAPDVPLPPSPPAGSVAKEGHLVFAENRKGLNFEKLFAPYLADATRIVVTDPYIRLFYQARNMMELLELIIRRKNPEDQVSVHLLTASDEGNISRQRDFLDSMVAACAGSGVTFTWAFDGTGTAHARHIVTDTGWKISLDRGLDIFQQYPMNEAFNLANRLQEHRAIKQFEVTYLRVDGCAA